VKAPSRESRPGLRRYLDFRCVASAYLSSISQKLYSHTMPSFNEQVYALVRLVPRGRVITYGSVARLLGDPRKAREVGWAMSGCPNDVPAHRVINRLGSVSGEADMPGGAIRRVMLEDEGIVFDERGRCDLKRYEWLPRSPTIADA
jgi:methylated-DNA-protein-cysteine methyltransferase-like protein